MKNLKGYKKSIAVTLGLGAVVLVYCTNVTIKDKPQYDYIEEANIYENDYQGMTTVVHYTSEDGTEHTEVFSEFLSKNNLETVYLCENGDYTVAYRNISNDAILTVEDLYNYYGVTGTEAQYIYSKKGI